MRFRVIAALLTAAFVSPVVAPVQAQQAPLTRLFIHTGHDPYMMYDHLRYGGRDWKMMTTLLQGTFDITTGNVLPSIAALDQYDALWIDQRYGAKPTTTDLNTMLAFASTGRRVVIMGENSYPGDLNFFNWSAPFVQALGGQQGAGVWSGYNTAAGCRYGDIHSIFTHSLTNLVSAVDAGCSGYVIGGIALFDYNAITLWGQPQNVLTIMDTNILDDYWGVNADGPQFKKNLVSWLDQSAITAVPEPATYAMLAPALLGIAAILRRRQRRANS